jgi:fatty-acyl-CoA synthase
VSSNRVAANAWLRALELTAPITGKPHRILPMVIEELADRFGETPALLSDRECLTYRALGERSNRYARWALDQGLARGDTVCLFMPNRPEYMAIWIGVTRVGGVVALLNTHLAGPSLAHCLNIVAPRHIIADARLLVPLTAALPHLTRAVTIWAHGASTGSDELPRISDEFPRIDGDVERRSGEQLSKAERRPLTIEDRALYIYTSGTTGLPKAAHVNHYRLMQASYWFAGMTDARSSDRMYDCLPMYHIVGGVQAPGAVLVAGGSVVIREGFSAREFWNDIVRWDCTVFQYIGELCRYLLHTDASPREMEHRVRMCCGNGLRPDVWSDFKSRFRIPQILEFYAATEGNVSLFNVDGTPGAIGRIPSFLAHRSPTVLVKFDVEHHQPVRNDQGFCLRCAPNEVGEAIGKVFKAASASAISSRFEGYSSKEDSEKKILRDVFEPGDVWFRTGDLMRRDEKGYFYFVDRIGDTFRWKGENVATSEVSEAICAFPGIEQANVYGVAVPGTDGRAGMASLVANDELDLVAFRIHLIDRLPAYARPVFLRIRDDMDVTSTFKYTKNDLVRQGYDPVATGDVIYVNAPEHDAFVQLDTALYDRILAGQIRL